MVTGALLLMLHNSIPHSHEYSATQLEELNINGEFDFLKILSNCFQYDLGEDHLENFSRTDHQMPHFDYLALTFDSVPVFTNHNSQFICDNQKTFAAFSLNSSYPHWIYYLSSQTLRAPPVFV